MEYVKDTRKDTMVLEKMKIVGVNRTERMKRGEMVVGPSSFSPFR